MESVNPKHKFQKSYQNANCFSRMFFTYGWNFISKVKANNWKMKEDHIEDMRESDTQTEQQALKLAQYINESIESYKAKNLPVDSYRVMRNSVLKTFRWPLFVATFYNFIAESIAILYTFFIYLIIKFIQDKDAPDSQGLIIFGVFVVANFVSTIFRN